MRKLFYTRLALSNIRRNRKFYLPYMLTCICTIAMFYIIDALNAGHMLDNMRGEMVLRSYMAVGGVVIATFAIIFLFYTTSFLTRRRRHEFGLYNILGMEKRHIARIIQDRNPRTVLVFATAHEQYMRSAFEVYAFDYLVKPIKLERALNTLALIRERLTAQSPAPEPVRPPPTAASGRLMLKHREGLSFLDIPSILLIQREERASVLYLSDGSRYVTSDSLGELEQRLPE